MAGPSASTPITVGGPAGRGRRIGIVVSHFNGEVTGRLLDGALKVLEDAGVERSDIEVVRVPGAWEIPFALDELAASGGRDALIAIGAVIRGETPHFDAIVGPCAAGCGSVGLRHRVPVTFGVLTCDSAEQAMARAGGAMGNKGSEAALAALEMALVFERVRGGASAGER